MTYINPSSLAAHEHREVLELLPWYVNDTLDAVERQKVESHLALCLGCQTEVARWQTLAKAVQATDDNVWHPSSDHLAHILGRIDKLDPHRVPRKRPSFIQRWWSWLGEVGHTPRWAVFAPIVVACGLAVAALWPAPSPLPPSYETLSDGPILPRVEPTLVRLVFADTITERQMRTLLTNIGASIVQGPSAMGTYTVALPLAATDRARLTDLVTALRTNPNVRLVEPVSPSPTP
ncbi:MAG: anti-sigma factor family protein [Gammaproteobacteria bacterium]